MKFRIYWRNLNKTLLFIFAIHILWLFLYKNYFLQMEAPLEEFVIIGEIYLVFATGVITGYPFYLISYEVPKLKDRIAFNPTLMFYVDKIKETMEAILFLLSYSPDKYNEIDNYSREELHADFKERLGVKIQERIIASGKSRDDIFEETMSQFANILNELDNKSSEHFKYFHKYLTIEIIHILKQISTHNQNIFNITRGIIAYSEFIGLGMVTKNDHGFIALELADLYLELQKLIESVNEEVEKYS